MTGKRRKAPGRNEVHCGILPIEALEDPIQRRARALIWNKLKTHKMGVSAEEDEIVLGCCRAFLKFDQGKGEEVTPDEIAAFYRTAFRFLCEREAQAARIYRRKGAGDPGVRAIEAAEFLDWPTAKYENEQLYTEFYNLTHGYFDFDAMIKVEAITQEAAYIYLSSRHGFPSAGACKTHLKRYIRQNKRQQ